jgi:hypothetical protein
MQRLDRLESLLTPLVQERESRLPPSDAGVDSHAAAERSA